MDDVGDALTGGQVDPVEATKGWDDWLQRPGNRTALLQMGINLMQPVGIGQTPFGQIGQAIGAAGEAQGRVAAQDLKEEQVDNKLSIANQRLAVAQQNADANTSRANTAGIAAANRKIGGLSDVVKARFARQDEQNFNKQLDSDAKNIVKQANDVMTNPDDPVVKQYKGKTVAEVRDILKATRKRPNYGAIPSNDDSSDDGTEDSSASGNSNANANDTPPVEGARKAADGNYYVPDPKRPGKYLRVN